MRPFASLPCAWVLVIALLMTLAEAMGAEPPPPAGSRPRDAAIIILDGSLSMGRYRAAARAAAYEWVADGFHQQWKDPSWLEFWTFGERPNTSRFEPAAWSNRQAKALADRVLGWVDRLRYEGSGRPDLALSELGGRLPRYETVHALILTDGEIPLKGTPFDTEINWTIRRQREKVQTERRLFIVALRATSGKYEAWRVGLTGERVILPARPEPATYDLAHLMAPHRPASNPPPAAAKAAAEAPATVTPPPQTPPPPPAKAVAEAKVEPAPPPPKPVVVATAPVVQPKAEPVPAPAPTAESAVALKQAESVPPPTPALPAAKPPEEMPPVPAVAAPPGKPAVAASATNVPKPAAELASPPEPATVVPPLGETQAIKPAPPTQVPALPERAPRPAGETQSPPPSPKPASPAPAAAPERTSETAKPPPALVDSRPAPAKPPEPAASANQTPAAAAPIAPHPRLAPSAPAAAAPPSPASILPPPAAQAPKATPPPPTTNLVVSSDPYSANLGMATPGPAKAPDRRPLYLGLGALLLLLGGGMMRWVLLRREPRNRSSLISRSLERPK